MNIRFLESVICLAELKNFRATAERLNITPAAISSRISAIEEEIGFRLFERDSRQVSITPQGIIFIERARDVMQHYQGLINLVGAVHTTPQPIRLGIVPALAFTILPEIMNRMAVEVPGIHLSVTTNTSLPLFQKLCDGELDIVLIVPPEQYDGWDTSELCTLGMYWVASAHTASLSGDEPLSLTELCHWPLIGYEEGSHNDHCLNRFLENAGIEGVINHHSNSLATTIKMVIAGLGVSVLPPVAIQTELREGELKVLNVIPPFPSTRYCALFKRGEKSITDRVAALAVEASQNLCAMFDDHLAYR